MRGPVVQTLSDLQSLLDPILRGRVEQAAFDVETTSIVDERFTPWGTPTRLAGFSISYDLPGTGPSGRVLPTDVGVQPQQVDFYVPLRHTLHPGRPNLPERWRAILAAEGDPANLPLRPALELLRAAFLAPGVREWIGHEWRFDAAMVWADGVEPPWARLFDTKAASVLSDPRPTDGEEWVDHSLKSLAVRWLDMSKDEKDLVDEARKDLRTDDFSSLPLYGVLGPYAARDTRMTLELRRHIGARPSFQDPRIQELFRKHMVELRLAAAMEKLGVRVDPVGAAAHAKESEAEVLGLVQDVERLAGGRPLNLGHGETLAHQLYVELGLPRYRGLDDTRQATLKQVRQILARSPGQALPGGLQTDDAARLVDSILAYRRAHKELTSFYLPLTRFGDTGRVHTTLRTMQAKTTRYSSAKPNVQQMPRKGGVRGLFLPGDGKVFLLCDYQGQELRVAAHYAAAVPRAFSYRFTWRCTLKKRGDCKGKGQHGDGVVHFGWREDWSYAPDRMGLIEGFLSGDRAFDPHQAMATQAGVERPEAKGANFALIYGAGPPKLAETLDRDFTFAKMLHHTFWNVAYPELGHVRRFIDERLRRTGPATDFSHQDFIRTLHGGRIYLTDGYYGLNYVVQRSCREILLNALVDLDEYLVRDQVPYELVMPVHDELIFEVPTDSLDRVVVREICRIMVRAGRASKVPMVVEPNVARKSWADKEALPHEWGWHGVLDGVPE